MEVRRVKGESAQREWKPTLPKPQPSSPSPEASLGPAQGVQALGPRGVAGACAERSGARAPGRPRALEHFSQRPRALGHF
eukprot:6900436-Pyramimonas_sp.AAC.1